MMEKREKVITVGFTGTQKGMTDLQKAITIGFLIVRRVSIACHGGCIGADIDIDDICWRFKPHSLTTVVYPSNIKGKQGKWHYTPFVMESNNPITRNHFIVDRADFVIACPAEPKEILRSGTWATIRYAKKQGKHIVIIAPDGTLVKI